MYKLLKQITKNQIIMKHLKSFLKILVILLLVTQNSFAASKPVPRIGIVVKKNPGTGGQAIVTTSNNGGFSIQLEAGEYELSFPQDQLKFEINSIIGRNYPKSTYLYDGSGVELTINNPEIIVMLKPSEGNIYTIEAQNSSVIITVTRDGTTLSGILGWNDAVLTNSVTDNRGIDKADVRRMNSVKENPLYNEKNREGANPLYENKRKGWDGSVKGKKVSEKGIKENGLKKNDVETASEETQKMAIKEQGVKKSEIETASNETQQKAIDAASKETAYQRISMNVTVPKQTQGATFGEKVNSGKINVTLVEGGCVVLFPSDEGYRVNTANKTIQELSTKESIAFGERVNQGLHAAGGALAQGASLLGGSLPGGAVISAAVSSVGNLAGGAGGGAAAASYAATGRIAKSDSEKKIWEINDNNNEAMLALPDGEFELSFVIVENAASGLKDTIKTQVIIGFVVENNVIKKKEYVGHVTLMK